ncbi:hypothetical protein [Marinobacterium arenosum]|uniref:hypothetical protein n=1 Tax=Marinobacterium arenosum TaxID=2862496 RepID=UPI001C97D6EB|nr:hypothetical protein [Marinobacterium arenosum]MBY4677295.1 hypothetical protein [Marinobacterium arenosum]
MNIPERDWKRLRSMKQELLNEACQQIFDKVEAICRQRDNDPHAAYLKLWKLLSAEDEKIVEMFDDHRRSTALLKLIYLRQYGFLSDDDLALFSEETQQELAHCVQEK